MANIQQFDESFKLLTSKTVGIIDAAFSGGQARGGVEQGPKHLMEAGIVSQLQDLGWTVNSKNDCQTFDHLNQSSTKDYGTIKNAEFVSAVCKVVSTQVSSHVAKGHLALTLGGDHSLAMATISGSARVHPNIGVLWIDAHADINTAEGTESGNLHGCPVSYLMGMNKQRDPFNWLEPCLKPDRIVYIGLRDVDAAEKKILKDNNIKAFSMYDVDKHGIGKIVDMALEYLGDCPLHMTFDVDALDPSVAPSTGTPVRGGLTFREGHFICERVCESQRLVAMDIMEVNPCLGNAQEMEQTVKIGCSLVRAALGETLL